MINAMVPNNEQNEVVADVESRLPWRDDSEILTDPEESSNVESLLPCRNDSEILTNLKESSYLEEIRAPHLYGGLKLREKEAVAVKAIFE